MFAAEKLWIFVSSNNIQKGTDNGTQV